MSVETGTKGAAAAPAPSLTAVLQAHMPTDKKKRSLSSRVFYSLLILGMFCLGFRATAVTVTATVHNFQHSAKDVADRASTEAIAMQLKLLADPVVRAGLQAIIQEAVEAALSPAASHALLPDPVNPAAIATAEEAARAAAHANDVGILWAVLLTIASAFLVVGSVVGAILGVGELMDAWS